MPTSTYSQIPAFITFLEAMRPASILDVGVGNGKMGFIARDLLDVMHGRRYARRDWQLRIDGVEVFAPYIQEHQRAIYDDIYIGNAAEVIERLGTYDVIVLGDVLEHFERPAGEAFLDASIAHARMGLILNVPLGPGWTQEDIYGNDFERHRSVWVADDFAGVSLDAYTVTFPGIGEYATYRIPTARYRSRSVRQEAERLLAQGQPDDAAAQLQWALTTFGPEVGTAIELADALVHAGRLGEALASLETARLAFPADAAHLDSAIADLRRGLEGGVAN